MHSVDQYLIYSPKFCKYFCADCFLCNLGLCWTNSHFSFLQVVKSACRLLFLYYLLLTNRYQKKKLKQTCQFIAMCSWLSSDQDIGTTYVNCINVVAALTWPIVDGLFLLLWKIGSVSNDIILAFNRSVFNLLLFCSRLVEAVADC